MVINYIIIFFSEYDQAGNLISEKLLNDLGIVYHQIDQLQRNISIRAPNYKHTIDEFSPDGQIQKMTFISPSGKDTSEFFYDSLKQLKEEKGLFNKTYLFDSNKNRLQKDNDKYEINDLNQIVETDNNKYIYDKNGNPTIQKTPKGTIYYKYDALDRLIQIEKPQDYSIKYTYDSFNRRTSKTYLTWADYLVTQYWSKKYSEEYFYDNQNEIGIVKNDKISHLRILKDSTQAEIGSSIDFRN